MTGAALWFLAVGLAMDAFAVAVSDGLCWGGENPLAVWPVALTFGGMQGMMPAIGYLGGQVFAQGIHRYEGLAALLLLGTLGGKMIWEAMGPGEEAFAPAFSLPLVLVQGLATSIDALAVGLGLALLEVPLTQAVLTIGGVTFLLCGLGFWLGRRFGERLGRKAGVFGGVILLLLGIKLFLEHTT